MKKIFILLITLATFTNVSLAQNTFPVTGAAGIGTSTPNAASLLDITSTTKGVLIPRMTKVQRDAIIAPVEGLMVYQTNSTPGFYFFDGDSWEAVAPKGATKTLGNLTAPTKVDIDLLPATDNTVSIGSAAVSWKDANFGGNANFDGKGYFLGGLNVGSLGNQTATVEVTPSSASALRLNPFTSGIGSGSTGELQMMEATANGFNYVGFKAPTSILANKIWTLPAADGTNGQVLSTNGAGVLSWVTGTGGGAETDPQVGTVTTSFVPRWDGAALSTGTIYDNGTSIGIGSSSPLAKVYISSDASSTTPNLWIHESGGNDDTRLRFTSVAGVSRNWEIITKTSNTLETANKFRISQTYLDPVELDINTSDRFVIDNDGQIGIGTSLPESRLHVFPGSSTETPLMVESYLGLPTLSVSAGASPGVSIGTSVIAPEFGLRVLGQSIIGSSTLTLDGTFDLGVDEDAYFKSRVAIGTTAPNSTLHVNAAAGENPLRVQLDGTSKLYVNATGQVAVNTAAPTANMELSVNGDTYSSSQMFIGGTSGTAKLNIEGGDGETVSILGTAPLIKLKDAANSDVFVQASGNNLRMGTLSGNSAGKLVFRFNGTDRNGMDVNGNFGLGTISPSALFHLKGTNEVMRIEGTSPFIQFYNSTTAKSFIWSTGNDLKIGISTGNNTGRLILGTAGGGDQVFLDSDGTVGIGTSDTKGYKLGVDGNIVCEELKVKLSQNWPDYVFADEYKLPSLSEVEKSIQLNKHLPGIPSAKEIHEEGINVGEMQKLMMQKIEELTLYVIDLQKQNNDLKSEVTSLRSAID
jgi:hypothetical protein